MTPFRHLLAAAPLLTTSVTAAAPQPRPYLGADLSFANEMQDCGAIFRQHGKPVDPFALIAESGGNLVRVRTWNDATWTNYSGLSDVERTIRRAKGAGLQVLLDFHYSDDWADGDKRIAPGSMSRMTGTRCPSPITCANAIRRADPSPPSPREREGIASPPGRRRSR